MKNKIKKTKYNPKARFNHSLARKFQLRRYSGIPCFSSFQLWQTYLTNFLVCFISVKQNAGLPARHTRGRFSNKRAVSARLARKQTPWCTQSNASQSLALWVWANQAQDKHNIASGVIVVAGDSSCLYRFRHHFAYISVRLNRGTRVGLARTEPLERCRCTGTRRWTTGCKVKKTSTTNLVAKQRRC